MALYWTKYLFVYIGGWALFQMFNANYPGFTSPLEWAFTGTAFQKAVVWSIFYELTGIGCGWGPMNGRFKPMFGGFRHFLRPGTTKLSPLPGLPLFGGIQRTWLDVALYAANHLFLLRALVAPEITAELLWPSVVLIPLMGIGDKTLFLAARAEHYWVALTCIAVALSGDGPWISFCKLVWCFIWFWAATSKVNHHFPSVIQVMMNNGPFFPSWLKKRLFVSYPDDLRPGPIRRRDGAHGNAHGVDDPVRARGEHRPARDGIDAVRDGGLPRLHRDQQPERHADRVEHPDDLRRHRAVRLPPGGQHPRDAARCRCCSRSCCSRCS